jgi:DNA helicase-2/ATP-dependent DNA helicase PcrA
MTRAKDDLHLVFPQRFFVHGQYSKGDRHRYASRARFITEALLPNFEKITRPVVSAARSSTAAQAAQMDIKAHMRRMCTET